MDPLSRRVGRITLHAARTFFIFLASFGGILVVYGAVCAMTGQTWAPLEKIADRLSASLTFLGTALTAASIYVPAKHGHAPSELSKFVVAPLVLLLIPIGMFYVWATAVSPTIVNGVSLIGLSGGLLRIVPAPFKTPAAEW